MFFLHIFILSTLKHFQSNLDFHLNTIDDFVKSRRVWLPPDLKSCSLNKVYVDILYDVKDSAPHEWICLPFNGSEDLLNAVKALIESNCSDFRNDVRVYTENLHKIADNLPSCGYMLDVLWFIGEDEDIVTEEYIGFLGSMKRLVDWNNAQVWFCKNSSVTCNIETSAIDFIHAIEYKQSIDAEKIIWRGKIFLTDDKGTTNSYLPGFSLVAPDNVKLPDVSKEVWEFPASPSWTLEFLDEIDVCDIPWHVLTGNRVKLKLMYEDENCQQSKSFLQYIKENKQNGILVRLWVGKGRVPSKESYESKGKKNVSGTDLWKEMLLNNEIFVPNQNLPAEKEHHVFLLNAAIIDKPDECSAYLLANPSDFNGAVFHDILMTKTEKSDVDNSQWFEKLMTELPSYPIATLVQIENNIGSLQEKVIEKFIKQRKSEGQDLNCPKNLLIDIVNGVREEYLKLVAKDIELQKTELKDDVAKIDVRFSEVNVDPNLWLERMALAEKENQIRLRRTKSSDKLGGISPPRKDESVEINAAEFLKLFTKSGERESDIGLKPILLQARSKKLLKYDEPELRFTPWPQSQKLFFHDLYYNITNKAETNDVKLGRIRDRNVTMETSSMFNQMPAASTKTMHQTRGKKKDNLKRTSSTSGTSNKAKDKVMFAHSEPSAIPKHLLPRHPSSDGVPSRSRRSIGDVPKGIMRTRSSDVLQNRRQSLQEPVLRRSPRKSVDHGLRSRNASASGLGVENSNVLKPSNKQLDSAAARAERHRRHTEKLESIVSETLKSNGMPKSHSAYKRCANRLFRVTKSFVMDLKDSRNLRQEMKRIAEAQVKMVINFESEKG